MTPRFKDGRVAVYDDFLSAHEREELLRYLAAARYRRVLPEALGSAFRLGDGDAFVGTEAVMRKSGEDDRRPAYPTETALDIVVEKLRDHRPAIDEVLGEASWSNATVCPYLYPVGCGLSWHTDKAYAGAYIYYAHPKWSAHWGGELLVAADCGAPPPSTARRPWLSAEASDEPGLAGGMGYYFTPTPNRMIYLRGGTFHAIKKVEAAAGDNLRVSVSGFFMA